MQTKDKDSESLDESDFLLIENLTQEEWSEIRNLSVQIYQSGQYGSDQMKCSIQGFLLWLSAREMPLVLSESEEKQLMH